MFIAQRNTWAGQIRKHSAAFMGEKSANSLKAIAIQSMKDNTEASFVPTITQSREIVFSKLKTPPSADESSINAGEALKNNGYEGERLSNLFGFGHTHIAGFLYDVQVNKFTARQLLDKFNQPTNTLYGQSHRGARIDYKSPVSFDPDNPMSTKGKPMPLFIGSPIGVSIYGTGTDIGGETKLNYNWFSTPRRSGLSNNLD